MSHWAKLDENNKVIEVLVGDNNLPDEGYQFIVDTFGGTWVKTSYTTYAGKRYNTETWELTDEPGFRKNYAGIGFTYDPVRDAFIPPKPEGDGWVLNEQTCLWEKEF